MQQGSQHESQQLGASQQLGSQAGASQQVGSQQLGSQQAGLQHLPNRQACASLAPANRYMAATATNEKTRRLFTEGLLVADTETKGFEGSRLQLWEAIDSARITL